MRRLAALLLLASACTTTPAASPPNNSPIQMNRDAAGARGPVRNLAPQAGQEITTIRYWKIRKGTFTQFLKASQDGIWPYFEKIGARIVGMWKVVPAPGRFSTVTGWPQRAPICGASVRAMPSAALPADRGTSKVIGFAG